MFAEHHPQRVDVIAWRYAVLGSDLRKREVLTAMVLGATMDFPGATKVSIRGLAAGSRQAKETVQRSLSVLEEGGWIVRDDYQRGARRRIFAADPTVLPREGHSEVPTVPVREGHPEERTVLPRVGQSPPPGFPQVSYLEPKVSHFDPPSVLPLQGANKKEINKRGEPDTVATLMENLGADPPKDCFHEYVPGPPGLERFGHCKHCGASQTAARNLGVSA